MIISQLSVFLENKSGRIAEVLEVGEEFFQDRISQLQNIRTKLGENLESATGLGIKVTLVEPKTIERSEGKSKRVFDKRSY